LPKFLAAGRVEATEDFVAPVEREDVKLVAQQ